jgi:hypothetical protein
MLGRNGRTPPAAPQPPPQPQLPQPNADIDHNSDDYVNPRFEEWHEMYVADAEAEAAEEAAQWGEQQQVPVTRSMRRSWPP